MMLRPPRIHAITRGEEACGQFHCCSRQFGRELNISTRHRATPYSRHALATVQWIIPVAGLQPARAVCQPARDSDDVTVVDGARSSRQLLIAEICDPTSLRVPPTPVLTLAVRQSITGGRDTPPWPRSLCSLSGFHPKGQDYWPATCTAGRRCSKAMAKGPTSSIGRVRSDSEDARPYDKQ